jgi:hypothetical protein
MIPGNSVRDANPACRPEPDDAGRSGATAGYDTDHAEHAMSEAARSPRTHRPQDPLQDIQDIIDELAAVTKKLRCLGDKVRDPLL